jgi:fructokinase
MFMPLIFGEVLYDIFPDGSAIPGGAPFNVAWHLQGFGLAPVFLSRIGEDALGARLREKMQAWGMRVDLLQQDSTYPTGQVHVHMQAGAPQFTIAPQQAYDYIDADPARLSSPALIYHGSLALRHHVSRASLARLQQAFTAPVFLDINLRSPWWTPTLIESALRGADWVKLNEDELRILFSKFSAVPDWDALLSRLCAEYGWQGVIVTLGSAGALIKISDQALCRASAPVVDVIDSVGAGDAFSAVSIYGILHQWPAPLILTRAAHFAAAICGQRGAVSADKNLYATTRQTWQA